MEGTMEGAILLDEEQEDLFVEMDGIVDIIAPSSSPARQLRAVGGHRAGAGAVVGAALRTLGRGLSEGTNMRRALAITLMIGVALMVGRTCAQFAVGATSAGSNLRSAVQLSNGALGYDNWATQNMEYAAEDATAPEALADTTPSAWDNTVQNSVENAYTYKDSGYTGYTSYADAGAGGFSAYAALPQDNAAVTFDGSPVYVPRPGERGNNGLPRRFTTTLTSTETTTLTTTTTTTGPRGPWPFLFCWSHMQVGSYEEELIKFQITQRASIFACNGHAVISTERRLLGQLDGQDVYSWANPAQSVGMGRYGVNGATTNSFLNTATFLEAWDTLMASDTIWPFHFVVKADPDAVFFPDRLRGRGQIKGTVGQAVYFPNCGKFGQPLLYGSLEVFSVQALGMYQARVNDCKRLPWGGWGEDFYMQHCMDMIGVRGVTDYGQVGDNRCWGAPCSDWTKVAFHDFKDPQSWEGCYKAATGGR